MNEGFIKKIIKLEFTEEEVQGMNKDGRKFEARKTSEAKTKNASLFHSKSKSYEERPKRKLKSQTKCISRRQRQTEGWRHW